MDPSSILVAKLEDTAIVRVIGKGSFKNASALKQFAESIRNDGVSKIILDMKECVHMDSTFMGVLAGISSRQKSAGLPPPVLTHLKSRNRELLETLGLDRILTLEDTETSQSTQFNQIQPIDESSKQEVARTMLEAHEQLVEADSTNAAKFQDVILFLRDKLGRSA